MKQLTHLDFAPAVPGFNVQLSSLLRHEGQGSFSSSVGVFAESLDRFVVCHLDQSIITASVSGMNLLHKYSSFSYQTTVSWRTWWARRTWRTWNIDSCQRQTMTNSSGLPDKKLPGNQDDSAFPSPTCSIRRCRPRSSSRARGPSRTRSS